MMRESTTASDVQNVLSVLFQEENLLEHSVPMPMWPSVSSEVCFSKIIMHPRFEEWLEPARKAAILFLTVEQGHSDALTSTCTQLELIFNMGMRVEEFYTNQIMRIWIFSALDKRGGHCTHEWIYQLMKKLITHLGYRYKFDDQILCQAIIAIQRQPRKINSSDYDECEAWKKVDALL